MTRVEFWGQRIVAKPLSLRAGRSKEPNRINAVRTEKKIEVPGVPEGTPVLEEPMVLLKISLNRRKHFRCSLNVLGETDAVARFGKGSVKRA